MWGNEGLKVSFIKKPKVMRVGLVLMTDKQNRTKKTYCNPIHQWKMGTADYWQVMGSFKCSDSDVT